MHYFTLFFPVCLLKFECIYAKRTPDRLLFIIYQVFFFHICYYYFNFKYFRPFSSIYPFNEREMTCVSKNFYLYTFFFLGEEVVSEVFLQGLFRHRHFSPFYYFIGLNFFILSRNLLASGRAT